MNEELMNSIRNLCRAGAAQTGLSMHYNEGNSGRGWHHVHVTIHPPGGGLVAWYATIDPDGDDTPCDKDGEYVMTLREMQQRLTDYIATHRKQEAA